MCLIFLTRNDEFCMLLKCNCLFNILIMLNFIKRAKREIASFFAMTGETNNCFNQKAP